MDLVQTLQLQEHNRLLGNTISIRHYLKQEIMNVTEDTDKGKTLTW
jgi:hypothetical protein